MRTKVRFQYLALACLAAFALTTSSLAAFEPTPAAAQEETITDDDYGVEVKQPKNWEKATGNAKAVAIFTHTQTQSQIEIVPTKLMTPDVADVFFNTFHKTLVESGFAEKNKSEEKVGDFNGKRTIYEFVHSGVTLSVHVFSFVNKSTAWIVVGYMQAEKDADTLLKDYEWAISNIKFKS